MEIVAKITRRVSHILFYDIRHDFYIKSSAIGQSGSVLVVSFNVYPMDYGNQEFKNASSNHMVSKNVAAAMFVAVSRPFFQDLIFYVRLCLCYCYSALCPTVIQTRRTSDYRRITTSLPESLEELMRNSRSRCLHRCVFSDWAKTLSVTQSPYSGLSLR